MTHWRVTKSAHFKGSQTKRTRMHPKGQPCAMELLVEFPLDSRWKMFPEPTRVSLKEGFENETKTVLSGSRHGWFKIQLESHPKRMDQLWRRGANCWQWILRGSLCQETRSFQLVRRMIKMRGGNWWVCACVVFSGSPLRIFCIHELWQLELSLLVECNYGSSDVILLFITSLRTRVF